MIKNKDKQLRKVINFLMIKYRNKIKIMDFWEADLCAIGISDIHEKKLIYISTYSLPKGRYNITLEDISENKENPLIISDYKDVDLDELEEFVKRL